MNEQVALPENIQREWEGFVQRYTENYVEDARLRLQPLTLPTPRQLAPHEESLLAKKARRNARFLYDFAMGGKPVGELVASHAPAWPEEPDPQSYNCALLDGLSDITKAMAAESKAQSYHLQRFILDRLIHQWVELRTQAAQETGATNFRMPRRGYAVGDELEKNNQRLQRFHAFWENEHAAFIHRAVRGLCDGYITHHARMMRKRFSAPITKEDIATEEEGAFRQAMRTYEVDRRSEDGRNTKAFASYLVNVQRNVSSHLARLIHSDVSESDAMRHPHLSLEDQLPSGDPIRQLMRDKRYDETTLMQMVADEERNALFAAFSKVLWQLKPRDRLLIVLRLGLEVPDPPLAASAGQQEETEGFRAEVRYIRDGITALRAKKRNNLAPHAAQYTEVKDASDLPDLEEMAAFLHPLNRDGSIADSTRTISHQAVQQGLATAFKRLIRLVRLDAGVALEDWDKEAEIVNEIYDSYWGEEGKKQESRGAGR